MKQMIKNILFGKPKKGDKINYNKEPVIKSTTVPYGLDLTNWQDNITQHGWEKVVNFFEHNRRFKNFQVLGFNTELS